MARPRKYEDAIKLERACEKYFKSITREKVLTEKKATGTRDDMGHIVYEEVPLINQLGHEMTVTEYLLPPTVHDLCCFLKIDEATWERYADSEKYPEFCGTISRVRGRMRAWNEHELLTREGKDLKGIIFNLENNYGYAEKAKVEMSGGLERYLREMQEDGQGQEF